MTVTVEKGMGTFLTPECSSTPVAAGLVWNLADLGIADSGLGSICYDPVQISQIRHGKSPSASQPDRV